jgi:hypothetical protein
MPLVKGVLEVHRAQRALAIWNPQRAKVDVYIDIQLDIWTNVRTFGQTDVTSFPTRISYEIGPLGPVTVIQNLLIMGLIECNNKSDSGHRFPMPHLSRRFHMRGGHGLLISSHMDVHSVRKATSGGVRTYGHMYGRMYRRMDVRTYIRTDEINIYM